MRILVETGFLLALNPRDKHHKWALSILERARSGEFTLYISPVAPIELSLILKSKAYNEKDILQVLSAMNIIIRRYTRPHYPSLELEHIIYASELRMEYHKLTFFDSLHASIALLHNLTYYDLDEVIKEVISSEKGK